MREVFKPQKLHLFNNDRSNFPKTKLCFRQRTASSHAQAVPHATPNLSLPLSKLQTKGFYECYLRIFESKVI